jgi:PilZ domain
MSTSDDDRRRHVRHPIGSRVRLFLGAEELEQPAEVVDLSQGGMRVRTRDLHLATEDGIPLHVYISLPDGRGAMAVARVVRTADGEVVFRFDAIDNADGDRLGEPDMWTSADEVYVVPIGSQTRSAILGYLGLGA